MKRPPGAYEVVIEAWDPDVPDGRYRERLIEAHRAVRARAWSHAIRCDRGHGRGRGPKLGYVFPTDAGPLFFAVVVGAFQERHPPDAMFMVHPDIVRERVNGDPARLGRAFRSSIVEVSRAVFEHWRRIGWQETQHRPEPKFIGRPATLLRDLLEDPAGSGRDLRVSCSDHGAMSVDRARLRQRVAKPISPSIPVSTIVN